MNNFPLYLQSHLTSWIESKVHTKDKKECNDIVELIEYTNTIKQYLPNDFNIPSVFVGDGYSDESCKICERIAYDKEVCKISVWVTSNIILKMIEDYTITTEVKLRIASSMLRTTLKDDNLYRYSADHLITNIKHLQFAILDAQLPF